MENDIYIGLMAAYGIIFSSIAAVIQSGKDLPGLPNISILKSAVVRRAMKFYIWSNFNRFLGYVLGEIPLCCTGRRNKPLPVWLSTAGHCPCSLPPHPPDCHILHHWSGFFGRSRLQADMERGSVAGRSATAGCHRLCRGGTLLGLHLLPDPPQQGWQQGAECLWSGLLLHVTCGPHCTSTANALTHQIHQEHTHLTQHGFTTHLIAF